MKLLDSQDLRGWRKATKTKAILVKHLSAVLSDLQVSPQLLLKTLEGDQNLRPNAVICRGYEGEAWQQDVSTLLQKYEIRGCQNDGWWEAAPRSGNVVEAVQNLNPRGAIRVIALWGTETQTSKGPVFFQNANHGDWILRNPDKRGDVWVVKGRLFDVTYELLPEAPV